MYYAKVISFLGVIAMAGVIAYGFVVGDFVSDGSVLLANPWGVVSIVDLYVGFILFSLWIAFRESSALAKIAWIAAMMVFGFLTGAVYVLIALYRCGDDWGRFFLGARKEQYIEAS